MTSMYFLPHIENLHLPGIEEQRAGLVQQDLAIRVKIRRIRAVLVCHPRGQELLLRDKFLKDLQIHAVEPHKINRGEDHPLRDNLQLEGQGPLQLHRQDCPHKDPQLHTRTGTLLHHFYTMITCFMFHLSHISKGRQ